LSGRVGRVNDQFTYHRSVFLYQFLDRIKTMRYASVYIAIYRIRKYHESNRNILVLCSDEQFFSPVIEVMITINVNIYSSFSYILSYIECLSDDLHLLILLTLRVTICALFRTIVPHKKLYPGVRILVPNLSFLYFRTSVAIVVVFDGKTVKTFLY
jgi:hypothetical protein